MKVLAINGSARQNGNTTLLINHVFTALQAEGIETELVQLGSRFRRGQPDLSPSETNNKLATKSNKQIHEH